MARVDVKGLYKRVEALKEAALGYSEAAMRMNGRMSESTRSLRAAEANEAYRTLESTAIELVKVLVTGDDGKRVSDKAESAYWQGVLRGDGACPQVVIAAAFELVKKQPYAAVFARAEKEAGK